MAKFILFSETNELCGRYDSDIHGDNVPADAIQVSDDVFWQTITENDGVWKIDPDSWEISKHDFPPAPPYVPAQVTRAQGKAALITAGLWDDVESYANSIADETERALALVALNDTTHWQRTSPFLTSAAASIGLTSDDLDELFTQAEGIEL